MLRAIMRPDVHYLMDDEAMICTQRPVATQIGAALAGASSPVTQAVGTLT